MNILIAPDSFKGTITAQEVCDIIGQAFTDNLNDVKTTKLPAADGGEGLCECLHKICGGKKITAVVSGVFGEKMSAEYLMIGNKTAVIEMASCAGLPLAGDNKDPERATTFGVGELILDAKRNGAERILLGLGGSATNDCGFGMASALGWEFIDVNGNAFIPTGATLIGVDRIKFPDAESGIPITAACDVDNPLYGENGAAYVFAPQKGADSEAVRRLDNGLRYASEIINRDLYIDVSDMKGAGAAGGMGAGAVAFLNAELKRGIDILLDVADFELKAAEADLIITGEGRLDYQSVNGKVISGVAKRASALNKKVIAICGSKGDGAEQIRDCGVSEIYFSCTEDKPFDEIVKTCKEDLYSIAFSVAEKLKK